MINLGLFKSNVENILSTDSRLKHHITPRLARISFVAENIAGLAHEKNAEKMAEQLLTFCRNIRKVNIDLGNGYSLIYSPIFATNVREYFFEPHLIVVSPEGRELGGLAFRVGHPLEISEIQGSKFGSPQRFFRDTGKHFDVVAIDEFLRVSAQSLPFWSERKKPKVVFTERAIKAMRPSSRNRILARYCPGRMHEIRKVSGDFRVKEQWFSRFRKTAMRHTTI